MAAWWEKLGVYLEEKMPKKDQGDKARTIGVSPQSLSQWLNGDVKRLPPHLVSSLIEWNPAFDANYFFRDDWPAEMPEKRPAPDKPKRANGVEPFDESLIDDDEGPVTDPTEREIVAGHFYFGSRRIAAVLCFRPTGEPADLGGYTQGP